MAQKTERRLIWVPIIHTEADLGSVGESLRTLHARKVGLTGWHWHARSVRAMWASIRRTVEDLELDCARVRLYQDGLPVCGREVEIVSDLAGAGSENHQLLLDLMDRGAQLTGTESAALLVEEYTLVRRVLDTLESPGTEDEAERLRGERERILKQRDSYIAGQIATTLKKGETGLLFLGMLHSLEGLLPSDIELIPLQQATR